MLAARSTASEETWIVASAQGTILPSIQTYSALSALAMAPVSSLRFRSGLTENPSPCPCVNRVAPLPGSGEPCAHCLHAADTISALAEHGQGPDYTCA